MTYEEIEILKKKNDEIEHNLLDTYILKIVSEGSNQE